MAIKESFIQDEEFGEIEVRSNAKIKRYGIKILSEGRVVLLSPRYGMKESLLSMLEKNREWVRENLKRVEARKKIYDFGTKISTYTFDVEYAFYEGNRIVGSLNSAEKRLLIRCPKGEDLSSKNSQFIVKSIIENALTIEAKRILPEWLSRLAEKHGFRYKDCKIRKMHSRWGSCSAGSIHLSSMLLMLPEELIELVLIHELSHTVEMNHSDRFHQLVDRCLGGKERELEKQMRNYSAVL
ncbi:MAG: M48 family metallopeptidase [Paludibacteraceae bacterium]|nr:M48 family metallopeptidase [Paludibacteraceae bacterium]